ncbi:MAG: 30S ribosome-binding factor RbfA [Elusimicrobiota bacterium]
MLQYRRAERVASLIQEKVSQLLIRMEDSRLGFITVTDVWVSDDLKQARIYYSVMGSDEQRDSTKEFFEQSGSLIRREIGAGLKLQFVPQFSFYYDQTPKKAARVLELLKKIEDDDQLQPEPVKPEDKEIPKKRKPKK